MLPSPADALVSNESETWQAFVDNFSKTMYHFGACLRVRTRRALAVLDCGIIAAVLKAKKVVGSKYSEF